MDFFRRMRLTRQITLVIALTLFMGVGATVATLKGMYDSGDILTSMQANQIHHQILLKGIVDNYAVAIVDAAHKARDGALTMEQARAGITAAATDSDKRWREFLASPKDAEEQALLVLEQLGAPSRVALEAGRHGRRHLGVQHRRPGRAPRP